MSTADVTGEGLGDGELAEARRHITLLGELLGVLGLRSGRADGRRAAHRGGHCGDGLRGDRVDVVVGGRRDEPLGDLAEPVAGGTPDVAVRLLHPDPPGRQEDAERQDDERDGDGDQLVDQRLVGGREGLPPRGADGDEPVGVLHGLERDEAVREAGDTRGPLLDAAPGLDHRR